MHPLLLLPLAIACELVGTTALKLSDGFTRWLPAVFVVLGYAGSFLFLSQTLKEFPISLAYAIWSGVGTAGTVLIGLKLFDETLDPLRVGGIVLVILGVIAMNLSPANAGH